MRIMPQPIVEDNNTQRVQQLSLIFVYALDLTIENRIGVDRLIAACLYPVDKAQLGRAFGLNKLVTEGIVVGQRAELLQFVEIGDPAVADGLGDRSRKPGICQQ